MSKILNRAEHGRPAAPIRIIHLGIGNFTRAHQVWYTEHAADAAEWGIAGFPGRTTLEPKISPRDDALDAQEGLYQLDVQHPDGDKVEVISAVSASYRSHDIDSWTRLFADPQVAIVTSTITEAGYCRDVDGNLDLTNPDVIADLDKLKAGQLDVAVFTGPAKFVRGLLARRAADAGPITFVPCDNVPDNGEMAEHVIKQAAEYVDPTLLGWIDDNVGFVTTMVDRITPRATEEDAARVAELTGIVDPGLVVTEPFAEWVLAGEFKSPRPQWETMGAKFVDDIGPHEMRKLYLLNGSHSLMAYCGPVLGLETVYQAINDERVLGWVNEYWDDAVQQVPLPDAEKQAYRQALLERFNNPQMKDQLARIAMDGTQKQPIRIVPHINAFAERGEVASGATRAIAGWVLHLRGVGAPVNDANATELVEQANAGDLAQAVDAVLAYLKVDNKQVAATILAQAEEMLA
ncbi:MAG: mannitol dehydrogenase family protein [Brooklawnia sp.]